MKRLLAALAILAALTVGAITPSTALAESPCDDPPDTGGGWVCAHFTPTNNNGQFIDYNHSLAPVAYWDYEGYYWYNKTKKNAVVTDPHDGWTGDGHAQIVPAITVTATILTSTSQCLTFTNGLCTTWYWKEWATIHCPKIANINVDYWVHASYTGFTTFGQDGSVNGCF